MSKLARCALIFCLIMSFAATVAAQAPSTDQSNAAVIPLDLSQKIDDAAKTREQREQDIIKMIDGLRADFLKLIEETKGGDEQRSAALLQKMNDLQGLLSKQIDDNKTAAEARANGITQDVNGLKTSLDDLKKGVSPWVGIIVSILIAVTGFGVTWRIANSNRNHADTQRTEDVKRADDQRTTDINSANQQRNEDIKRADDQRTADMARANQERNDDIKLADGRRTQDVRRSDQQRREDIDRLEKQLVAQQNQMKRTAAYSLRNEWGQLHDEISAAGGYFMQPDLIDERGYSLIVKIGNWYDMIAGRYLDGSVDQSLAKELKAQAQDFLEEVKKAQAALAKLPTPVNSNFDRELMAWQYIKAL
jgi:hypothetical protein